MTTGATPPAGAQDLLGGGATPPAGAPDLLAASMPSQPAENMEVDGNGMIPHTDDPDEADYEDGFIISDGDIKVYDLGWDSTE